MRAEWGLLAIIPFLMLVHALPHIPGDAPDSPAGAYPELASRAVDALQGEQYKQPIHADEHIHQAWMAQVVRQETADIDDPYQGGKETGDLFTVQGMRSERGWNVAIVQFSLLTDMSLLTVSRFLPAIWAGFLGLTVWAALRPAPGAVAGAAMVAILPTTLRFLGVGFLVPSSFAIPWIFVTLIVASKVSGAPRFFGLILLITAAHFMHLVLGMMSIAAAVAGTAVRGEPLVRRASMLIAALLPLLWILPATIADARDAVLSEHTLPFIPEIFRIPGLILYALAALGAALAFAKPALDNRSHRALALMAIPLTMSMFLSIINDHRNEATYARIIFAFFLSFTCLATYGLARGLQYLQERSRWPDLKRPALRHAVVALAVILLLPTPLAANMAEPYYRFFEDETTWDAAERLDDLALTAEDIILAHPERGPLYSAISGARLAVPFTPSDGAANNYWEYYVATGGADEEWLKDRAITYIIGLAPNAPHEALGAGVFRLR